MLECIIAEFRSTIMSYWDSHKTQFKKGHYYWVTIQYKSHLRTLHVKEGYISHNVANLPYNYFKSEREADYSGVNVPFASV